VAITRVFDAKDPIKTGDRIYNELYEKGKTRYIALAGRLTGKISNDEAAQIIRRFGDHYQERVDQRTNYLVVGEGYETHPNFALAQEWGVKILLERTLYDYLGVK
jgi:NAD-dependent DNA ligase